MVIPNLLDVDQPPISVIAFLGKRASFNCSIREGDNILWYVDGIYVPGLPPEYDASFTTERSCNGQCITSVLQIRAIEQTNNSLIQCAVVTGTGLNRTYFPPTTRLLVQGIMSLHVEASNIIIKFMKIARKGDGPLRVNNLFH